MNPYQLQYSTRQAADGTWAVLSWDKPFLVNVKTEDDAKVLARDFNAAKAEAERNGEIEQ